jgi:NTP pyrophosphatase (non-canonical NTP hydrolase)
MNTNEITMPAFIPQRLNFEQLRYANIERQKEWDADAEFSELFFANALGGETGELAEVVLALQIQTAVGKAQNIAKKIERHRLGLRGSEATLADLGKELADVVFYVDLLANKCGLDLATCLVEKYNEVSDKYGMVSHIGVDGDYFILEIPF